MADFFARPIVCNTGPLIALSRVNLGHLLPKLFPRVVTTQTVVAELTAKDAGDGAAIRQILTHVEIVATSAPDPLLVTELDAGEVLLQAKREGLLPSIRPVLESLVINGYYIGPQLMSECLRRAGE